QRATSRKPLIVQQDRAANAPESRAARIRHGWTPIYPSTSKVTGRRPVRATPSLGISLENQRTYTRPRNRAGGTGLAARPRKRVDLDCIGQLLRGDRETSEQPWPGRAPAGCRATEAL